MTQVVGYAFDADIYCIECTREYCEEKLREKGFIEYMADIAISCTSLEKLTSLVKDSEGNDLHPVFDTDEQIDTDQACGSWTAETHEVVVLEANYFTKSKVVLKLTVEVDTSSTAEERQYELDHLIDYIYDFDFDYYELKEVTTDP